MEETRIFRSNNFQLATTINRSFLGESWEEQAFAEDAAGALGWPPRSYSCSFCGREFRSAQALGGHMNVHRREKARSKQVHGDRDEILDSNEKVHQYPTRDPFKSMTFHNPNPRADLSGTIFSTSSSSKDVFSEKILFSPSTAEEKKRDMKSPIAWSQFKKVISTDGVKDEHGHNQRIFEQEENYIKADLSVSLNLVICHSNLEVASCKRKRDDKSPSKPIFEDKLHVRSEVIGLASTAIDDLDLELRLGGRPRMN